MVDSSWLPRIKLDSEKLSQLLVVVVELLAELDLVMLVCYGIQSNLLSVVSYWLNCVAFTYMYWGQLRNSSIIPLPKLQVQRCRTNSRVNILCIITSFYLHSNVVQLQHPTYVTPVLVTCSLLQKSISAISFIYDSYSLPNFKWIFLQEWKPNFKYPNLVF